MTTSIITYTPPPVLKMLAHDLRWQLVTLLARSDYRVAELAGLVEQPMNLISYHLRQLREHRMVSERRSSADGRDVYYTLEVEQLGALYHETVEMIHPGLGQTVASTRKTGEGRPGQPARVLFLCTHNSARSQMAEALLRHLGGNRVEAFSAGSEPTQVHPEAIARMAELGIDIGRQTSQRMDLFVGQPFDYVITVCDRVRELCPVFPDDPERIHWSFADPVAIEDEAERRRAFKLTARQLIARINLLLIMIDRRKE